MKTNFAKLVTAVVITKGFCLPNFRSSKSETEQQKNTKGNKNTAFHGNTRELKNALNNRRAGVQHRKKSLR